MSVLWSLLVNSASNNFWNSRMNTVKRCRIFSILTLYRDTRATLLLVNFFKSMRLFRCLFLTSDTPCSMVFIVDFEQENTHWVYSDFSICVHISCQRQILNVVGFLDPHLHCTEFTAKAVSWFKLKMDVYVYLHTLEESIWIN